MSNDGAAVLASEICKTYQTGNTPVEALINVNLRVEESEFVTIGGVSGSGKTTLLNIISGMDKPTSGSITTFGEDLVQKDETALAEFRCKKVGFVFQSYNLVSTLTVAENVAFPMEWLRKPPMHIEKRVEDLLELVGLRNRHEHFPSQLSGGEQQRVAFARALANDPPLILADEPTGNLDAKTSAKIFEILKRLEADERTIIVATHDEHIAKSAHQKMLLEDGMLVRLDE